MKRSETGEYEVVVGNRQLLSAFFVVALLLGVAFAMGYMLGQNTPRSTRPQLEASAPASDPGLGSQPSSLPAPPPAPDSSAQAPPSDAPASQPATSAPEPVTQPTRDTAPSTASSPAVSKPAPAAAAQQADAGAGSFWQVLAVKQEADAQPFLQTLRDGGMPAVMRKGTDGWVRVLVGPYADRAAMAKAKEKLETQFRVRSLIRK
jgi:cell division septation protein DedD